MVPYIDDRDLSRMDNIGQYRHDCGVSRLLRLVLTAILIPIRPDGGDGVWPVIGQVMPLSAPRTINRWWRSAILILQPDAVRPGSCLAPERLPRWRARLAAPSCRAPFPTGLHDRDPTRLMVAGWSLGGALVSCPPPLIEAQGLFRQWAGLAALLHSKVDRARRTASLESGPGSPHCFTRKWTGLAHCFTRMSCKRRPIHLLCGAGKFYLFAMPFPLASTTRIAGSFLSGPASPGQPDPAVVPPSEHAAFRAPVTENAVTGARDQLSRKLPTAVNSGTGTRFGRASGRTA
jgi:hypothetical protein